MPSGHALEPMAGRPSTFVIDAYARKIVGWRVSIAVHAGFVLDASEQAVHDLPSTDLRNTAPAAGGRHRSPYRLTSTIPLNTLQSRDRGRPRIERRAEAAVSVARSVRSIARLALS